MIKLNLLKFYNWNKTDNINGVNVLSLFFIANFFTIYFLAYPQPYQNKDDIVYLNIYGV